MKTKILMLALVFAFLFSGSINNQVSAQMDDGLQIDLTNFSKYVSRGTVWSCDVRIFNPC